MRGKAGVGAKRQRLENKQKVVGDESNVEYVVDTFNLGRIIDTESDVCAMCKQGHDFGVLMQRIMPSISDIGFDHIDGDRGDEEHYLASLAETYPSDDELPKSISRKLTSNQTRKCPTVKVGGAVMMGVRHPSDKSIHSDQDYVPPLDPEKIWISRYSLDYQNRRVFIHFYCALYSPRTWFTGVKWHNVMKEVSRSSSLVCCYCKQRGATIGCYEDRCNVVMHFPCAVRNGYRIFRYSHAFLCPDHSNHKLYFDKGLLGDDKTTMLDVSSGKEPIPVQLVDPNLSSSQSFRGNSYNDPEFHYVNFNVDSDEVVSNSRNVDGLSCCECEDLCDDPEQCNCLVQGRNYTYQGMMLNPSIAKKIIECNIKCSCSYRRCTNRVVEKGLAFQLQIFHVSDMSKKEKDFLGNLGIKYGVKTLDFIPQFAFVCQVNGQFISGMPS